MSAMDSVEIQSILPHRYPFLLVDRISELDPDRRIVGFKNVTINEPFFQGHFPGRPVMPGVLILEALAQVGGVLAFKSLGSVGRPLVYLTGVDAAKFRKPVVLGKGREHLFGFFPDIGFAQQPLRIRHPDTRRWGRSRGVRSASAHQQCRGQKRRAASGPARPPQAASM